jgi:L-seryl-tRNA(Ser) seleniumtransferase
MEDLCRRLPQIGRLIEEEEVLALLSVEPREVVVEAARRVLARIRTEITTGLHTEATLTQALENLAPQISQELGRMQQPSLRRVINATGVILQTNLGRAPLSAAAIRNVAEVAGGYCNLEFDLETGRRGRRDVHTEHLVLRLLAVRSGQASGNQQAAMIVNNCAAATFLALNSLAEGGEVIVSRGELVEIGGGFRIPDILRKSGATLREVGTTNRTRLSDYTNALTQETRMILRVHRSNFRIDGFTEQPRLEDLVALGRRHEIPVFEDQGTGCVVSLENFGVREESSWVRSFSSGVSLLSASGDKLLGGPQAGILVGERTLMERIRTNPLTRTFRPGKLTYVALESTLLAYLAGKEETIPAMRMLRISASELRRRCETLAESLRQSELETETVPVRSVVGGGTTPGASLPGCALALRHPAMDEDALTRALRALDPPVIARTRRGRVLLDLRTVAEEDDPLLSALLSRLEPIA